MSADDTRIDGDAPTEQDDLGREAYVRTLARIVQTAETPLVIAIYGAWGSGKTSLMMQLRRQLDPGHDGASAADQRTRTVWFDPWMHQFDDSPALALLHAAAEQLGISAERNVVAALSKLAVALGQDIQVPFVGIRVGKLLSIREALAKDDLNRRDERARFRAHFHEVLHAAGAPDRRIVFFVDDLDRCQPAAALSLLEALKLYLEVPGCVYVLGVDREPLEAAVGVQYSALGLRAASYLDKIIQLPFAIPAISESAMASFVEKRLPGDLSICAEIVAAATLDEPRNVKRLINSLLINHELATEASFGNEYDARILTMVVLIQNQAPDLYRQLRLDPSLIRDLFESRDAPPSSVAASGGQVGLWALHVRGNPRLERALSLIEVPADIDLTPYITLTTIAPVQPESSVGPSGQVFISYRREDIDWASRISDSLAQLGWSTPMNFEVSIGTNVQDALGEAMRNSVGVIALISPGWLEDVRIHKEGGFVRSELEYAAGIGKFVIPVLVDGATMPWSELPEDLKYLARLQALTLDDRNFSRGMAELDSALRRRYQPGYDPDESQFLPFSEGGGYGRRP